MKNSESIAGSALVADIGGTNARFALADRGGMSLARLQTYPSQSFDSLQEAVGAYLSGLETRPEVAALAIAGPVARDRVRLTNRSWSTTVEELRAATQIRRLAVVNDFEALALSLPRLQTGDLLQIGGGEGDPEGVKAVVGPGTGLGVAGLVRLGSDWTAVASEGGHISFAVTNAEELALLARLHRGGDHVSAERALSGPGLVKLYAALAQSGQEDERALLTAEEIVAQAKSGTDALAVRTLDMFVSWLGRFVGDVALLFGARGGVYLGGGIPPKISFALGSFRAAFEAKGRLSGYVADIPVYVITAPDAGLRGAAAAAVRAFA